MTTLDRNSFLAGKLREFYESHPVSTEILEAANALDALSSIPAQAVGVKALEWVKIAGRTKADGAPRWAATHPFGHYEIVLNTRDMEWWSPQFASKLWDSEAEAKSYVQAAHAQTIASMLAPSQPAAVGVTDEIERLKGERDAAIQQAAQWKGEAMAHKSSLHEAYQLLTGAEGEPGNWNGARPISDFLQADREVLTEGLRAWAKRHFGKWITHATAQSFCRSFDIERRARARAALVHRDQVKL